MEFRCSTCVILSVVFSTHEVMFYLKALVVMYVLSLFELFYTSLVLMLQEFLHRFLLQHLNDLLLIAMLVLLLVFSLVSEVLDLKLYFADDIYVAVRLR